MLLESSFHDMIVWFSSHNSLWEIWKLSERCHWMLRDCFWSYFELTTNEKLFSVSYTSTLIDDMTIFCLQNDGLDMALFIVCNRKSILPPDRYFLFLFSVVVMLIVFFLLLFCLCGFFVFVVVILLFCFALCYFFFSGSIFLTMC